MLMATVELHISLTNVLFHFRLFQSEVIRMSYYGKNPRNFSSLQQESYMHFHPADFRIDSLCCEHSPYPTDWCTKIQSNEHTYEK